GTTVDLTNQTATVDGSTINAATWTSSNPAVATIDPNTGVATALTSGVTTITAIVKNPDGSVVTGTSALTVNIPTAPEPLVSLSIAPTTQTASSANETAQFIAIGTTGSGTTVDLTDQSATVGGATINPVQWSSSDTSVATIDPATGLATALTSGTTAITAIATNPDGTVVATTATFTVKISSTQEPLVSLTLIPTSQSVDTVNETGQFLAIGTFSSDTAQVSGLNCSPTTGTTRDCTSAGLTWVSSDVKVATVNSTGLTTGLNAGSTAITAIAKNSDGSLVIGTASFTEKSSGTGTQYATLTITLVGDNATNGQVTIASPGNPTLTCTVSNPSGCVATLPLGTTVTLTPSGSATFSGWSLPCNSAGTGACSTTVSDNETIAAIFN
ncbi:MAG: Ig-like domain-containing protein, partial [Acidobacteriota bacterium]